MTERPPVVYRILSITGLDCVIPNFPALEQALAQPPTDPAPA
jgi:hypothetical protein